MKDKIIEVNDLNGEKVKVLDILPVFNRQYLVCEKLNTPSTQLFFLKLDTSNPIKHEAKIVHSKIEQNDILRKFAEVLQTMLKKEVNNEQ